MRALLQFNMFEERTFEDETFSCAFTLRYFIIKISINVSRNKLQSPPESQNCNI